jgi:hypothetical protein
MGLTLINLNGVVVVQVDDETDIVFEEYSDEPPAVPPTSQKDERGGRDLRTRPIILGPKTRPPLPTSVQLTRMVGRVHKGGSRPLLINLDRDIVGNHLSSVISKRLAEAIAQSAGTINIDVYVPMQRSIDMTQLSRHIADVSDFKLRSLTMRVGGELEEG